MGGVGVWWQFGVKDGDIHKLNIILNLEFLIFDQEAYAGQTSEYWKEIAKDPKGYKMQVEKYHSWFSKVNSNIQKNIHT
jgi:hypothetical protein